MKTRMLTLICLTICLGYISAQDKKDIEYIRTYAAIAVEEMKLYKIPASITIAQGLVETADGQSELAKNANNHFGIKCKAEWTGETYRYTDDAPHECFRKYNTVQESYRDHSKFLAERPYYKSLFYLNPQDYKSWAYGLKKAGYATNPKYAPILISRIEKYQLYRLDSLEPEEVAAKLDEWWPGETIAQLEAVPIDDVQLKDEGIIVEEKKHPEKKVEYKISVPEKPKHENPLSRKQRHATGNYYIVVLPGESLQSIAKTYNISVDKLLKFNELKNTSQLRAGQNIFFRPKKSYGAEKTYKVQAGDTMYIISQKMGIKLSKLYQKNKMRNGSQPTVGSTLLLQGK